MIDYFYKNMNQASFSKKYLFLAYGICSTREYILVFVQINTLLFIMKLISHFDKFIQSL